MHDYLVLSCCLISYFLYLILYLANSCGCAEDALGIMNKCNKYDTAPVGCLSLSRAHCA